MNYWEERYQKGETGWDAGKITTPIKEYIDQLTNKNLKILIPGAGNGYEFDYLIEKGFQNVYVIDIAETPLENIKKRKPEFASHLLHADFFTLETTFDLILEQTFFCALNPNLRSQYLDKMVELLSQNGTLAGLLFASHFKKDGPPFGGDIEEYKTLFGKKLYILSIDMCYNSIVPRQGNELFFICKKI